jgi:hypothetical protein
VVGIPKKVRWEEMLNRMKELEKSKGSKKAYNYMQITNDIRKQDAQAYDALRDELIREHMEYMREIYANMQMTRQDPPVFPFPYVEPSPDEIEWHTKKREDYERGLPFGYAGPYLSTTYMAYKLPKYIREPHLVLRREEFVFAFPFDQDAVNDLKRLPLNQRKWDPKFRLWRLSPTKDVLLFVIELSQKFYGIDPVLMSDGISVDDIIRGKTVDNSTFYSVLGIHNKASELEIKRAFRQKAAEYHPDKGGDVENFHKIRVAYETLKDPKKRKRYDAALKVMAGQKTNVAKVYRKSPW